MGAKRQKPKDSGRALRAVLLSQQPGGRSTLRSWQIRRMVLRFTSECLGTADDAPFAALIQIECRPPPAHVRSSPFSASAPGHAPSSVSSGPLANLMVHVSRWFNKSDVRLTLTGCIDSCSVMDGNGPTAGCRFLPILATP